MRLIAVCVGVEAHTGSTSVLQVTCLNPSSLEQSSVFSDQQMSDSDYSDEEHDCNPDRDGNSSDKELEILGPSTKKRKVTVFRTL